MRQLIEVRVPTYRRPHLLNRCLASLVGQSCEDWRAIVLDDSPDKEGRDVVAQLADPRIIYLPNAENLGCSRNLDLAFDSSPMCGGTHACVLEDDNWFLPNCLQSNLEKVLESGCRILLRNQRIVEEGPNGESRVSERTTRADVFGERDRILSPIQIRASMFFCEGLSNGGLFWKLDNEINLVVGPMVTNSPMQEHCRSLQVKEAVFYAAAPLAVFCHPTDGSTTREALENRVFNRGRQSILSRLLKCDAGCLHEAALNLAGGNPMLRKSLELAMAEYGIPISGNTHSTFFERARAWAKGRMKELLVADPLRRYWQQQDRVNLKPKLPLIPTATPR